MDIHDGKPAFCTDLPVTQADLQKGGHVFDNTPDKDRRRRDPRSFLVKTSREALAAHTFDEASRMIFDACREQTGAQSGYVALLSKDGLENEVLFLESGGMPCSVDPNLPMPIRGLRADAYRTDRVVFDNDFANSEWMRFMPEGHVTLHNVMFAPLIIKGKAVGLIGLANKPEGFTGDDAELVGVYADLAAVILRRVRNEEALRDQEEELAAIYDNAPVILMLVDEDRRIRKVNELASRFTGSPTEEMIGHRGGDALRCFYALKNPQGCGFGPECEQCTVRFTVLDTISTGKGHNQVEAKLPFMNDGEIQERYFLLSTVRLNIKGQPMALVCFLDITETKKAEEEKARLADQLRQAQKMEAVGRLAGGVAHEFNNLMQAVLGQVDLLKSDLLPESVNNPKLDELKGIISEIVKAAKKGGELTGQLLAFSRMQPMQPADIDLDEVIGSVLRMIRPVIGEHIIICFTPSEDPVKIHADKGQVELLLMNLCLNARDAMPEGGKMDIKIQNVPKNADLPAEDPWYSEKNYVLLAVSDTGHGMDEATRARLFEPFFTTKGVGQGTGLGLATVYGIVEQHKGMIRVWSEPEKGTSFMVYFPSEPGSR